MWWLTMGGMFALSFGSNPISGEWKTTTVDGIVVRSHSQPGSAIREFLATATLSAPIEDIQSALLDIRSHASFMPYVVESQDLGVEGPGNARLAYTRLEFPLLSSRDFVLRITVDKQVTSEGGDEFATRWVSEPGALQERSGVIRLRLNEGSWKARRISSGETAVAYRFRVDPAGWIPPMLANDANRRALPSVFRSLEAEAKSRETKRRARQAETALRAK
jgi:hypothetical protein